MLLFFGIVFAFCTCGKRPVADLPTFHVDVKQRDSASCFFSGYSYVMLETNMECLLTDVDRISGFRENCCFGPRADFVL